MKAYDGVGAPINDPESSVLYGTWNVVVGSSIRAPIGLYEGFLCRVVQRVRRENSSVAEHLIFQKMSLIKVE